MEKFENELGKYLAEWKAHGQAVTANFEIFAERFVIVAANENLVKASGCSIDALGKKVRELLNALGVGVGDISSVFYRSENGIQQVSRPDFAQLVKTDQITEKTLVFDLSVNELESYLKGRLELPFIDSWHAQAFPLNSSQ